MLQSFTKLNGVPIISLLSRAIRIFWGADSEAPVVVWRPQVQAECGVDRVLVDSDESMVRIVGRSKEAVAAARSRLEYDVWCLPLARDLLQSSGDKIEALLERVRTKNKLAEADVQEDQQGLWVRWSRVLRCD